MENHLFNLKFAVKQLERSSKKAEKEVKNEKNKCKKAMEKQNMEMARIHAQNSIRQQNAAQNYLRLSARIDAVAQRVEAAIKMNMLSKSMGQIVQSMGSVMQSLDVDKIANVMDSFETQFDNLDVRANYMDNSISSSVSLSMPEEDVERLMSQVADEHGLEFQSQLQDAGKGKLEVKNEEKDLEARLKALQGI